MTSEFSFVSRSHFVNVDRTQRSNHAVLVILLITTLLGVCGLRLWRLQVVEGSHFRQLSEDNRVRLAPIPSDRGNILDRKGRLLAANRLARSLYLWPRSQTPESWQETAQTLSSTLDMPAKEIVAKLEEAGYKSAMPVRVARDLSPKAFVGLAETSLDIPGIEIQTESNRYYPNEQLAAHVVGYIGEATKDELKQNPKWPMGMISGQMGIERSANEKLAGVWGNRLIEVNSDEQEQRVIGTEAPKPGTAVQLTLDLDLQRAAETALANRRGAVVALDTKTGAVLALASGPTFDPSLFTRRITNKEWNALQAADKPFLNRALQGYPAGSTFKIVTAVAGMMSGKFDPGSMIATSASITVGGIQFFEHSGGYGVIGFRDALAYSSNTFFYQVGMAAGPESIAKWGHELGIGSNTSLDLLGLDGGNHGSLPTPEEKEKLYGEPWYAGDTVSMSIGQGPVLVTPLELAVMVSTIANGGMRVKPHLRVDQTNTPETRPVKTTIRPEVLQVVREGLIDVVRKGTARRLSDGTIPLSGGKTGTAEVPGGGESNAMYVGFAPADRPTIAVAVAVEHGGYGGVAAAPIAMEIYRAYFKTRH